MLGIPRNPSVKAYVIEFLIVIFGITAAFQIEKLDNNRRESAAHETLRRGLLSEIDLNLEELRGLRQPGRNSLRRTAQVLELLVVADENGVPELEAAVQGLTEIRIPDLQSGQLDAYLASDLTATSGARSELIVLRGRLDELEEIGSYRADYVLERFLPLLSPYYDFSEGRIMDVGGIRDFRFRNAVALLASLEAEHLQLQGEVSCAFANARAALAPSDAESGREAVATDCRDTP